MTDDVAQTFDSGGWEFNDEVVAVFDEHVADNVPHYGVFQDVVAHLSDWLVPDGAVVIDLGAATGTTCSLISQRHPERSISFCLVDAEQSMLDAAAEKMAGAPSRHTFHYRAAHLPAGESLFPDPSDLVLALFTLQFIPPIERGAVLREARAAAKLGSGIVVAEKVTQPTAVTQEIANEATWDYKADRGVSAETIRAKARALRGVLRPLSPNEVEQSMVDAGWGDVAPIWRWHCWGLWAATAV